MEELWLSSDVAKALRMTPAGVRAAAVQGRLETEGTTVGGVRFFTRGAIEKFRQCRVKRAVCRRTKAQHAQRRRGARKRD